MTDLAHIRKTILQVTQVELAAICEVAQSTVSRWERGAEEPSQSHIKRMLDWAEENKKPLEAAHFFGLPTGAVPSATAAAAPAELSEDTGQLPPADEAPDDPVTRPTPLDPIIATLIKDGLLPRTAETKSPRTYCKVPGKRWRLLPDSEAPPMEARIIRTEWNGAEWVQTFDSHEPVRAGEAA